MAAEAVDAIRITLWILGMIAPACVAFAANAERLYYRAHNGSGKAIAWIVFYCLLLATLDVGAVAAALLENVNSALGNATFQTGIYFAAASPFALILWAAVQVPDSYQYHYDWFGLLLGAAGVIVADTLFWVATNDNVFADYTPAGMYLCSVIGVAFVLALRCFDEFGSTSSSSSSKRGASRVSEVAATTELY
jgi:hypothetical protein